MRLLPRVSADGGSGAATVLRTLDLPLLSGRDEPRRYGRLHRSAISVRICSLSERCDGSVCPAPTCRCNKRRPSDEGQFASLKTEPDDSDNTNYSEIDLTAIGVRLIAANPCRADFCRRCSWV